MSHSLKFVLVANCIPVKGVSRSVICDTQNNNYFLIPNGLYDILEAYNGQTINFVKQQFDHKYDDEIDEYFDFLISENLIFFSSDPSLFPKLDLKWESSSIINNIIIDYDNIKHNFGSIVEELEYLKCSNIQCRFYSPTDLNNLSSLVDIIDKQKSRITSIDFILPFDVNRSKDEWDRLLKSSPRIHSIILYNAPENQNYDPIRKEMGYLSLIEKNILNEKHCGNISSKYFTANVKLFTESLHYNTCLNKKVSIDKNGEIRNCPSMMNSFGNITKTTLRQAIGHPEFKKYWNISKDKVEDCKVCEFRHICTDCRAYLEEPENIYSKPLKCGYSPHTTVWEDWSSNPLKEMGIKHYELQELLA